MKSSRSLKVTQATSALRARAYRREARGGGPRVWGHQSGASEVSVCEGYSSVFGRG